MGHKNIIRWRWNYRCRRHSSGDSTLQLLTRWARCLWEWGSHSGCVFSWDTRMRECSCKGCSKARAVRTSGCSNSISLQFKLACSVRNIHKRPWVYTWKSRKCLPDRARLPPDFGDAYGLDFCLLRIFWLLWWGQPQMDMRVLFDRGATNHDA